MALLSDLTREQHRTKAMAMIGMSIGVSFAVAMVLGPVLTHLFGLHGLFWFTAGMALVGLLLILFFVPQPDHMTQHRESSVARQAPLPTPEARRPAAPGRRHPDPPRHPRGQLRRPAAGTGARGGLPREQHWWVYLTALLVGFFGMVPFIIYAEKKRRMKRVLTGAVATLLACELFFLVFGHSLAMPGGRHGGVLHCLQPARSLAAVAGQQGLAGRRQGHGDGVYSTSQFLGAALGGILGGWMFQHGGLSMVFIGCAVLAALWLAIAVTMREPPYVTSIRLPLAPAALQDAVLVQRFRALPGVADAVVVAEEAAACVKVDTQQVDRTALEAPGPGRAGRMLNLRRTSWPVGLTKSFWLVTSVVTRKPATCPTAMR